MQLNFTENAIKSQPTVGLLHSERRPHNTKHSLAHKFRCVCAQFWDVILLVYWRCFAYVMNADDFIRIGTEFYYKMWIHFCSHQFIAAYSVVADMLISEYTRCHMAIPAGVLHPLIYYKSNFIFSEILNVVSLLSRSCIQLCLQY